VPSLVFHVLEDDTTPFTVCGVTFQPLLGAAPRSKFCSRRCWYLTTLCHSLEHEWTSTVNHGATYQSLGYRFDDISYISDVSLIPEATLQLMSGSRLVILDALNCTRPHASYPMLGNARAYAACARSSWQLVVRVGFARQPLLGGASDRVHRRLATRDGPPHRLFPSRRARRCGAQGTPPRGVVGLVCVKGEWWWR